MPSNDVPLLRMVMTMSAQSTATEVTQAERLELRIKEHKEEVARLREELGNPAEALSAFAREHFSLEAFFPDGERAIWEEDDDLHRVSEELIMASQSATTTTQAERLAEVIKQHKEEVARLREELGDPLEALSVFVRDTFDLESLIPPDRRRAIWEEDDDARAW